MKRQINQSGFSAVELIIILVVVSALGFAGYAFYNRQQDQKTTDNSVQQTVEEPATASDVAPTPEIKSINDLDNATAVLDQTDPSNSNSSDTSQLDSELSAF